MSPDLNRIQASKQYFELRNALNHANKIKNLITELEFELRENDEEYFIIIRSSGAHHGLRLANKLKYEQNWRLTKNEKFEYFYNYMFKKIFVLKKMDSQHINTELTGWLLRLWII